MKAPFAIVPINNAVVRVLDAAGENVAVMPTRPATRLVVLVNTIPTLINTLKALSVTAWNAGNADLIDLACTGECAVRNIDPSFALIDFLRTTEIVDLEDLCHNNDTWAERFRRYDAQAKEDFAMYAWLEQQGKLPAPNRIGPATVRKYHAARRETP